MRAQSITWRRYISLATRKILRVRGLADIDESRFFHFATVVSKGSESSYQWSLLFWKCCRGTARCVAGSTPIYSPVLLRSAVPLTDTIRPYSYASWRQLLTCCRTWKLAHTLSIRTKNCNISVSKHVNFCSLRRKQVHQITVLNR